MKVIELYDAAHRNKNEDSFHMTVYDQTGMEILAYVFKDGKLPGEARFHPCQESKERRPSAQRW